MLGLGFFGGDLERELPLAVPGEVRVMVRWVMVGVVVDHVGGRGGFSLETWDAWEDYEAGEFGDIGGSSGWEVSRGLGRLKW